MTNPLYHPRPGRWPQFTLRGLFVLVTVFACIMCALCVLLARDRARLEAIHAIDRVGGTYGVGRTRYEWYRNLAIRLGCSEEMFYDPVRLSLGPICAAGVDLSPDDLTRLSKHLDNFSNLSALDLTSKQGITLGHIQALPALPKLQLIRFFGYPVSEEALREIRRRWPNCKMDGVIPRG